jgi:pectinesterase
MTNAHRICSLFALITIVNGSAFASAGYDFVVAKDSSGNFRTIQEAVNACRDYAERQYVIFVKNGFYEEKLVIPTWKTHITIIGQNVDSTVITYNDYSGKTGGTGKKLSTFTSFTCQVAGNNIVFENITFVNSAGRVGQAVAMHVEGDRCVFRNCKFIGNQDTLLAAGENARQYFDHCYIEGTTDFIFGPATAFFDRCTIVSKVNSYVTAASTLATQEFGFVFLNCKLLSDSLGRKVYLGRPWRLYAFTAFINCELGEHIRPEGWHNWSKPEAEKSARYMEYKSTGPGANPTARVPWSHQLIDEEVKSFTASNVLKGFDNWNPTEAK